MMEPMAGGTGSADEVMCHCSGTRREQIRALHAQGMDIQAISRWTGALSGCGGCEWDIADLLQSLEMSGNPRSVAGSCRGCGRN